jgi:hypothetical protein
MASLGLYIIQGVAFRKDKEMGVYFCADCTDDTFGNK